MVRLFIENNEIELTDDVQVAITSQFEDLSNPTTIINDWSKTVSIPFSTKNNETFGYIYNPDRLITDYSGTDYLSANPVSVKKWDGTGTTASDYFSDSLVNGQIVCSYDVEYIKVGTQRLNWSYSQTQNYYGSSGSNKFEFVYNSEKCYRFEFSLRNSQSAANNGEVYFVQWNLANIGLIEGETYIAEFKYKTENGNYIVYDFSLTRKVALTGIYFNPLQKLDFRLEWNSTVIMIGYAKLNEVKQVDGKGTYELTLFGQLGKVFQEMKKITFDKSTTDTDYLINGSEYVSEYINRNLVYDSWLSAGQYYSDLKKKNDSGYHLTDIIGFAPNNSFSEGFKYDSFQNEPSASGKFTDVLGESFEEDTGISPDTVIPNGMLPREIGEYRSYLQLPFIYWNKLFQVFQAKAEEITGYKFDLDESWFNNSNPYWYNLVYMLRQFNAKDGTMQENANYYQANPYGSMGWQHSSMYNTMTTHRATNLCTYTNGINVETIPMIDLSVNFNDGKWNTISSTTINPIFKIRTYWQIWDGDGSSSTSKLNNNNALIVKVNAVGENGYTESLKFIIKSSECTLTETGANTIIFDGSTKAGNAEIFNIDADFLITKGKFGDSVRFRFEAYWQNSNWSLTSNGDIVNFDPYDVGNPNFTYVTLLDGVHRSFAYFDLNDLWNNDFNLFGEILKYCKMYRISVSIDEFNKKIIFKPYTKLFENYTIEDWTNKIDKSKDFVITPVTLENKYVLFNYEYNKTKMGEEYKTKFGANYGEYRLVTDYNFNGDTKNIFEKVKTSIVNTDNVLSWTNINDNHKIVYSFPAEIYVYNKDKDNKQVDTFGSYYFHNGISFFSTEASLNLRPVCISDDTAFQQANNTYMYSQGAGNLKYLTSYPALDVVRGDNICLFNVPSENYTYINNYSDKNSIYTNLWKNYIDERYNIQNKKITCYVDLKPSEYNQFEWNKLVKVDRQLCIVNKIYDYDITSNGVTKVDLITIQDINGYSHNNYTYDYIISSDHELAIPYDYFKEITIKSSGSWNIKADDWRDYLVAFPESGTSGETKVIIGTTNQEYGGTITFELLNEDETEVIGSDYCRVSVGGTGNLSVTPWFNEISVGSSATVQMSAGTSWSVYKFDRHGNENRKVLTYPSIASTGTYNLTITVPSDSATGVVDVYLKQMSGDLITSYRVNIVA